MAINSSIVNTGARKRPRTSQDRPAETHGARRRLRPRWQTVHLDAALDYNRDPATMRNLLLYRLTVEAQQRVQDSDLSKRELIRRLGTSASQFYRLLDQTNYRKSVDQMLVLLQILDCDVELVIKNRLRSTAC